MSRWPYNLQFFQGEKTEKATPKKRKDAREKGQVVQSKDISSAAVLLVVFLVISGAADYFTREVFSMYLLVTDLMTSTHMELSVADVLALNYSMGLSFFRIVLPISGIAMLTGVIISYMQVGVLFTLEPLKFKLEKISFLKGLKRMFSLKSLVEMVKSILKAVGILLISYSYIMNRQLELMEIMGKTTEHSVVLLWELMFGLVIRSAFFLFVIAILDFAYKKWENNKELRMTKQEIKDEYKQMEGDPLVKSKIKEKQRQMAMSRMMQDVPSADVIITNPTHFAVALRYNKEESHAPKVVAKGRDLIAQNIKKIAKENSVPIVENKPLARTLYDVVDIGEVVPPELFEAVADVLAYVYQLKTRRT
jgi:flagellar biosynthetic protein FlhB